MTAVARVIAFHRVEKKDAKKFQDQMTKGFPGAVADAVPVTAMALGVISFIVCIWLQASLVMAEKTFHITCVITLLTIVTWILHERTIHLAKRAVDHPTIWDKCRS